MSILNTNIISSIISNKTNIFFSFSTYMNG